MTAKANRGIWLTPEVYERLATHIPKNVSWSDGIARLLAELDARKQPRER